MNEPSCPGCQALMRLVTELGALVKRLTRLLEQQRRASKRHTSPFAKGPLKPNRKKPGRKPDKDYGPKAHRPPPQRSALDFLRQLMRGVQVALTLPP